MYFVYVLYSSSLKKYYTGSTDDIKRRIYEHNIGKGNFSSKGIPWILIKSFECSSRSKAVKLELKIKKRS